MHPSEREIDDLLGIQLHVHNTRRSERLSLYLGCCKLLRYLLSLDKRVNENAHTAAIYCLHGGTKNYLAITGGELKVDEAYHVQKESKHNTHHESLREL
jgi:hypothetical protein